MEVTAVVVDDVAVVVYFAGLLLLLPIVIVNGMYFLLVLTSLVRNVQLWLPGPRMVSGVSKYVPMITKIVPLACEYHSHVIPK